MAEQKLSLIVDLVNKTEAQFKAIGDDFSALSKRTETMSAAFGGMAKFGTVAFAAIASVGVGALKAYASAEREMVAANVAVENAISGMTAKQRQASTGFKDSTQALAAVKAKMAEVSTAAIQLGFDDEAVSVAFGKLYQVSGSVTQAQQDVALAMDLAAFSGKDIEATTRAITMAYAGGGKVLKEFGIQLEDGASRQEVLAAVQAKASGAALAASQTLEGQMKVLQITMANTAEEIGGALAPALTELLKTITPIIQKVGEWVKENPKLVANIIMWTGAIAGAIATIGILGKAVLTAISILGGLKAAIVAVWVTLGPVGLAIAAVSAILVYTGFKIKEFADEVGGLGNLWKLTVERMKVGFLAMGVSVLQTIDSILEAIPGMGDMLDGTIASMQKRLLSANDTLTATSQSFIKLQSSATDASTKISTEIPKANVSISTLPTATKAATEAAKKHFDSLVSSVAEVRKNIVATYDEIKKAALDYEKSINGEKKTFEGDVVSTVANANIKKKELETELQDAYRSGDVSRISDVQKSLNEQLAIITTYQQSRMQLDIQIAAEQERLGMNELQRLIYDHSQKLTLMANEYNAEQAQRQQRIIELEAEQTAILAMVSKQTAAKVLAEAKKAQSVRERIAADKLAEKNWLAESITNYQNYANSVAAIMASISSSRSGMSSMSYSTPAVSGKRASGGSVQPGRTFLVGEKGPELFSPSQYGTIAANGSGGGMTIVITGNSFFGEDDMVDKIGSGIMRALQQNVKL